jgi:hypothetical protein
MVARKSPSSRCSLPACSSSREANKEYLVSTLRNTPQEAADTKRPFDPAANPNGKARGSSIATAQPETTTSTTPTNPSPSGEGIAAKLRKKRSAAANKGGDTNRAKRNQTSVPVRTPDKSWWFRCHRDPAQTVPVDLLIITSGPDEGIWFLDPEVEFPDELDQFVMPALLTRAITHDGTEFFYLAKQSDRSPKQSTRRIVNEARASWIKQRWNGTQKAYEFEYARQLRREPEWSNKALDELLEMAFDEKLISRVDHEVVNRLLFPQDEDFSDAEPTEEQAN